MRGSEVFENLCTVPDFLVLRLFHLPQTRTILSLNRYHALIDQQKRNVFI